MSALDLPDSTIKRSADLLEATAAIDTAKSLIYDQTVFTDDQINALEGVIDMLDYAMKKRMPGHTGEPISDADT